MRVTSLRVVIDVQNQPRTWSWQCEYCTAHGHHITIDRLDELDDLADMHAGCAGALITDALEEPPPTTSLIENNDEFDALIDAWLQSAPPRDYWYPR